MSKSTRLPLKFNPVAIGTLLIIAIWIIKVWPLISGATFWAEDGPIFLNPLLKISNQQIPEYFLNTYADQYWFFNHLLSFLIFLFSHWNISVINLVSAIGSLIVTLILASLWLVPSKWVKSTAARLSIFAYILLSPFNFETLGNITNIHDYLLIGSLAIFGWSDERGIPKRVVFWLLIILNAFSSINAVILLIALITKNRKRILREQIATVLLAVASVIQIPIWLHRSRGIHTHVSADVWKELIIRKIVDGIFVGQRGGVYLETFYPFMFSVVAIIILFIFAYNLKGLRNQFINNWQLRSLLAVLFCYIVLVMYSAYKSDVSVYIPFSNCGRYFFVTSNLTLICVAFYLESINFIKRKKLLVVTLVFVMGVLVDFIAIPKQSVSTYESWTRFKKCLHSESQFCEATIPPGEPWRIEYSR